MGEETPIDNKAEVDDGSDWTKFYAYYLRAATSPLYTLYTLLKRDPAPWEVSVAFFPDYLPRINLD